MKLLPELLQHQTALSEGVMVYLHDIKVPVLASSSRADNSRFYCFASRQTD